MISFEVIKNTAEEVYRRAVTDARGTKDLALDKALEKAIKTEEKAAPKEVLRTMQRIFKASQDKGIVMCVDTGLPLYRVRIGSEVKVPGDITKAIQEGVANIIEKLKLSHPCTTGLTMAVTNEPMPSPVIHYDFLPGKDYIEIVAVPKGTGSTPYSAADVLSWESRMVKKFVVDSVWKAGPRACPPYVVGVGIGGELETAAILATESLARPLGERNPRPEVAKLEEELLEAVNDLGIGPMGVGGKTTAWTVNVETAACCAVPDRPGFGWIPAAVYVNCYLARYGKARIFADGRVEYL